MSQHNQQLLASNSLAELRDARVAVVYTEWNHEIITELLVGFNNVANAHTADVVERTVVPGCFELPFACRKLYGHSTSLTHAKQPEAIVAFGAVIRGGTPHFDYVCQAVTDGILQLNLTLPIPVIFGVLTLDNEAQAWERLGGVHGHKGEEAAFTALKMIKMCRGR